MRKNDNKQCTPEFIIVENTCGKVAYCTRCMSCMSNCKKVFKADEDIRCCGCKACG